MLTLEHRRLDVYHAALDFVEAADALIRDLPPGRGYLADQLRRSSASIVLNIAEGAGEHSPRDKARFYRMALRSATESAASLDILDRVGATDAGETDHGEALLVRIVSMLTRLAVKYGHREGERVREREREYGRGA